MLGNSVGVLDSGYRGEVVFKFKPNPHAYGKNPDYENIIELTEYLEPNDYEIGDRIGQIIILPYPQVQFNVVDELSSTERGTGGFGSTN